jgi:uncharacterized integral membrane protein
MSAPEQGGDQLEALAGSRGSREPGRGAGADLPVAAAPAEATVPAEASLPPGPGRFAGTRSSATWTALAVGMVLLVAMVVFILQNLQDVKVTFFAVHWRIPLALDLLLAAVLGGAVVFSAGAVRLMQLRLRARRQSSPGGGAGARAHRGAPGPAHS